MAINYDNDLFLNDLVGFPHDLSAEEADPFTFLVPVDENDIPDDVFSKDPIELTDELVNKIDRYAEKQGKVFSSKFKRFSHAVQTTDLEVRTETWTKVTIQEDPYVHIRTTNRSSKPVH